MKKILYAILLVLLFWNLPCVSYAQTKNFTINGKIGSWSAPAKIYLKYSKGNKPHTDSSILKDGRFEINGSIVDPTQASLFLSTDGQGLRWPYDEIAFYVVEGVTTITSNETANKAVVTGTKINEDFNNYSTALKSSEAEFYAIEAMKQSATPALMASPDFNKKIDSMTSMVLQHMNEARKQFVKENPSSFISLDALQILSYSAEYEDDFRQVQLLYSQLTPEVQGCKEGKKFAQSFERLKALTIGLPAPVFTQPDTSGMPVSLSSFRGKYVLVDFWASWCKPCRKENPDLIRIYQTFKDKNFTMVGVSVDQRQEKWLKAIHDDKLPWIHLSDLKQANAAAKLYEIRSIPTNYLIGPDGRILGKNLHGINLTNKLAELLN